MKVSTLLLVTVAVFACVCFATAAEGEVKKSKYNGPIIGIDLGTTYSCVGVYKDGRVEMIANEQGNRITPSYVAFTDAGERLIGDAAKNQATLNPQNTIYDIKRFIGRRYGDSTVQRDRALLPFSIINKEGRPQVSVKVGEEPAHVYSPEEISAMVLTKMKDIAESYLGEKVEHAVVTVPAYFNDAQRQATKDAGRIAGLKVERIINEPTAAAIAYGLDRQNEDHAILVFDLGGGTFDVTVLTINNQVFDVLSTNGDTHLGGEDFDQRVVEYYMKKIKSEHNVDLAKNKRALAKLRRAAEVAKRALSTEMSTTIDIDGILPDGEDFSDVLTRAKFEQLNDDLFQKTMAPVAQALKDSGLSKKEIAEVVLVGGSTKIPRVQEILSKFFDGKKLNKKVNPDEAVAYGAAVQAAILAGVELGENKDLLVLDVAPLSLGMEIVGGVMLTFVSRNDKIPLRVTKTLTTEADYQTSVPITVFQGERPKTKDNVKLGHFDLGGIPPAKRGVPQVEVTFEVDEDSILHVSAIDTASKNVGSITITESTTLSQEEIERMVKDSEDNAEKDKVWRDRQAKAQEAEAYMYEMKHAIDTPTVYEGLSSSDRSLVVQSLNDLASFLEENKIIVAEDLNGLEEETKAFEAMLASTKAIVDVKLEKLYTPNSRSSRSTQDDDESDLHEEL